MAKNGEYGAMYVVHYSNLGVTEVRIAPKDSWQEDVTFTIDGDGVWMRDMGMNEYPVSTEKADALTALLGSRDALYAALSREDEVPSGADG